MEKKFHIVVVDDTMGENDPFVVELKLEFQNIARITYFRAVDDAMSFVDAHMSERIILIMDCRFGSVWQGIDAVKKLREKTSLIYVIMISANNVTQLSNVDIVSLINTDNIYFIKNTDIDGAKEKINMICRLWDSRFDCVLEEWIQRHPEDNSKEAYSDLSTGKTYSWANILEELRHQTPVGKSFEQRLNEYYLYQLSRIQK